MKKYQKNDFYPKIGKGKYGSVNPESDEGGRGSEFWASPIEVYLMRFEINLEKS